MKTQTFEIHITSRQLHSIYIAENHSGNEDFALHGFYCSSSVEGKFTLLCRERSISTLFNSKANLNCSVTYISPIPDLFEIVLNIENRSNFSANFYVTVQYEDQLEEFNNRFTKSLESHLEAENKTT